MKSDTGIAAVRTGWNTALFTAFASLAYKLFGWHVTIDDLLPFFPVIGIVGGAFYRLSRVIADKFPSVGFVLFGVNKVPTSYTKNE